MLVNMECLAVLQGAARCAASGRRCADSARQSGRHIRTVALLRSATTALCIFCRELLEAPLADAAELTAARLPVPRLVRTEHNGSQVRLIFDKETHVVHMTLCQFQRDVGAWQPCARSAAGTAVWQPTAEWS